MRSRFARNFFPANSSENDHRLLKQRQREESTSFCSKINLHLFSFNVVFLSSSWRAQWMNFHFKMDFLFRFNFHSDHFKWNSSVSWIQNFKQSQSQTMNNGFIVSHFHSFFSLIFQSNFGFVFDFEMTFIFSWIILLIFFSRLFCVFWCFFLYFFRLSWCFFSLWIKIVS